MTEPIIQSERVAVAAPVPPPVRTPLVTKKRLRQPVVKAVKPRVKKRRRNPSHRQNVRHELSAGGVVVRQEGDNWLVALLKTEHKRGEVWVLPKGHVEPDKNETISDAAKREVQEEAGISDVSVKNELGITRFRFQAENALVKKTVHYFLMITGQHRLVPQVEEGLIDAAWFPLDKAIEALAYDTDRDIVIRAQEQLLHPEAPTHKPLLMNHKPRSLKLHL